MWCEDPYVRWMKRQGYCLVRMPRADLGPTQLLAHTGKDFQELGRLGALFVPGETPLPPIQANVPVVDLQGSATGRMGAGLGLSILSGVIQALGGSSAGLEGTYQRARRLVFTFREVLRDNMEIIALDQFLAQAELRPLSTELGRMLDADELYVITAILKSRTLTVEAFGKDDAALAMEVPAVQQAVGGKVNVSSEQAALSKVTYEGPVPLVFGFQAVQLIYQEGLFSALKPAGSGLSLEEPYEDQEEASPYGLLESEGPFLHFGG